MAEEKNEPKKINGNFELVTKEPKSGTFAGKSFSAYVDLGWELKDKPEERLAYLAEKYGAGVMVNAGAAQIKIMSRTAMMSFVKLKSGSFTSEELANFINSWKPAEGVRLPGGSKKKSDKQAYEDILAQRAATMSQEDFIKSLQADAAKAVAKAKERAAESA